ncbi:MAG: hypothetical protein FWF36_03045, partial [Propionibacteriaceae bacterium]|nr:hypothetical protein [Propionibacteriaceae bacterium]
MFQKIRIVSVALAMVLGASVAAVTNMPVAQAAGGVGSLPKTVPTTSVVVLDLTKDKSVQNWQTTEDLLAISTIQGIVNRTSSQKIYLVNSPQKWMGTYNPPDVDQMALDNGLVPVPQTTPTLNTSLQYPVLTYLVSHYASYIKGEVKYPSLSSTVNDSAVMAAVTACAQLDAIPVSAGIESYLAASGYTYQTLADTTSFTSEVQAFQWAYTNYFQADTTRSFAAKAGFTYWDATPGQFPTSFDYYVANKAFIYSLDANDPAQLAAIPQLLNSNNYPPGAPVLGEVNGEGVEISEIQNCGYYFTFMDGANISVHSSFPSDPTAIKTPNAPTASPITSNGVYVSFYVTDGDNMSISTYDHENYWRNSPDRGQVAMGWSLPPIVEDLFPNELKWLSNNNYDDAYELVADYNDGNGPNTAEGMAAFVADYRQRLSNSNGMFRTINTFDTTSSGNAVIQAIDPYFAIRGYQGATDGNQVQWSTVGGTTNATISGVTQSGATPQEIANAVQYVVNSTTGPVFAVVSVGDGGHAGDPAALAAAAKAIILANNSNRTVSFLRPSDLAATWNAASASTPATSVDYEAENAVLSSGLSVCDASNASNGFIVAGL